MYSNVVMEVPMYHFESILESIKEEHDIKSDQELEEDHLQKVIKAYKAIVLKETGSPFEQSPKKQLFAAIEAVFRSWNNERAIIYRKLNNIPDEIGTAVNVQMMVFGNTGDSSGTGVAFTRNPSTGEKALFGEFLMNAQGEDVVAGIRTPHPIAHLKDTNDLVFKELNETATILEREYRNMQDIEFTIENGKFYMLQTRNGKRSAAAAIKIANDLVAEGLISKAEAINQLDLSQVDQLLHPEFDHDALKNGQTVVTNSRHYEALLKSLQDIEQVSQGLQNGLSGDLLAIDIRQALHHLGEITGEITTDDLLGNIFANFCIGK